MTEKDPYTISPFEVGADNCQDLAFLHSSVREWQLSVGQTTPKSFERVRESSTDLHAVEDYYLAPGGNFFIAKESGGKIIGIIGLRNDGDGNGVIKRLAVLPERHREGVGKALVAALINWAKENKFRKLSHNTGWSENAKPLYEQFGFKVLGIREEKEDTHMELLLP